MTEEVMAKKELTEEEYKLSEEVIKPIYDKAMQNNNSFAKYGVECYHEGYNKAKEDVKHDLIMKLKNEGIVKSLKDSILRNERLSSQEQQELCAWIECAMDFGENLDECAKELEEAKELIRNLLRVTYGEGWNYSLDWKVKAEDFLKE